MSRVALFHVSICLLLVGVLCREQKRQYRSFPEILNLKFLTEVVNGFHGCDIILNGNDIEPVNLNTLQEPITYYSVTRIYEAHYRRHPYFNIAYTFRPDITKISNKAEFSNWVMTRRQNCKVRIILADKVSTWLPTSIPSAGLLFSIRESVVIYTVIIQGNPGPVDNSNALSVSYSLLKRFLRNRNVWEDMRYFYHVVYQVKEKEARNYRRRIGARKILMQQPIPPAVQDYYLVSLCTYCKDGFSDPYLIGDGTDGILARISEQVIKEGVYAAHHRFLHTKDQFAVVRIRDLSMGEPFRHRRLTLKDFHVELMEMEDSEGKRSLIMRDDLLPGELILHTLMSKFANMSFHSPLGRIMKVVSYFHSREAITGPGHPESMLDSAQIPFEHISLAFVTSCNVTGHQQLAIFSRPFDTASWIWLCVTTSCVAAILYIASTNSNCLSGALNAITMIWRLLLENFHDIATAKKGNSKVFGILTLIMAIVGIVLTNGYKGVITSDLTFPSTYSGPTELHQLLDQNWTLLPYDHRKSDNGTKYLKTPVLTESDYLMLSIGFYAISAVNVRSLAPFKDSYHVSHVFPDTNQPLRPVLLESYKTCELNKSAFWVLMRSSFPDDSVQLPEACSRQLRQKAFVVGKDRFNAGRYSWKLVNSQHRPGPVFQSIQTLVEAGIQKILGKILNTTPNMFTVTDNYIAPTVVSDAQPLAMDNLIIASAFELWWILTLASMGLAILECLINLLSQMFTWR